MGKSPSADSDEEKSKMNYDFDKEYVIYAVGAIERKSGTPNLAPLAIKFIENGTMVSDPKGTTEKFAADMGYRGQIINCSVYVEKHELRGNEYIFDAGRLYLNLEDEYQKSIIPKNSTKAAAYAFIFKLVSPDEYKLVRGVYITDKFGGIDIATKESVSYLIPITIDEDDSKPEQKEDCKSETEEKEAGNGIPDIGKLRFLSTLNGGIFKANAKIKVTRKGKIKITLK